MLLLGAVALFTLSPAAADARRERPATFEELFNWGSIPFAIGHRGFGDNLGEDRTRPIEDTARAVRRGFHAGVSVVEVDVQLMRDGEVAAFHDDFLDDLTCLNTLTLHQLRRRGHSVDTLSEILDVARERNQRPGAFSGLVIVELKAAAPLCDPHDTQERAIVSAVVKVVRAARMTKQVLFVSFSPALLQLAATTAPEIVRGLSISGLQFLSAPEVEALLGLPVTRIQKHPDFGLPWAEIGVVYRLPGYPSVNDVIATAATVGARLVEADLFFLSRAGAPFVQTLHGLGFKVLGFTVNDEAEWRFLESLGVDGIYTNDVPLGVQLQAPLP